MNKFLSIFFALLIGLMTPIHGLYLFPSRTSLGTVTSGTWNGSTITVPYGGTGSTSFTAGSVVFSNGSILTQDNTNFFWDNTNKRLGLGRTDPGARLDVYGDIRLGQGSGDSSIRWQGGNNWDIYLDDTNDDFNFRRNSSTKLTIDGSGNVGVGTTAPGAPIHVATTGTEVLRLDRTATSISNYRFQIGQDLIGDSSDLKVQADTNSTGFSFRARNDDGTSILGLGINKNGMVGIGTTNPGAPLHVATASAEVLRLDRNSSVVADYRFNITTDMDGDSSDLQIQADDSSAGYVFRTRNAGGSSVFGLGINKDGKVGIGTTAPTQLLDVAGTVNATDYTYNGTASTGTGGFVRATSPTLVTPALGNATATGMAVSGALSAATSVLTSTALLERSGQTSDTAFIAGRLLTTKTSDMGNGFGSALGFFIRDDAAVINQIAEINAIRQNNSDTTGTLQLRSISGGTGFTNLVLGWEKNSTFNVANSGYVSIQNTATPYVGQSGDVIIKAGSSLSNSAGALQLGANYIGTELPGYIFNTRYGSNGSYRANPDMALSHYLGTTPNAGAQVRDVWETRMSFNYDRSIKFSTTGSASNNVVIDGSGLVGIGTSSPSGAQLHIQSQIAALKMEYTGGSGAVTVSPNSSGSLIFASTGTDSAAYYQFDKRIYGNKQSSFLGYINATATNKTGNGATYVIGTDSFSELLDQNAILGTTGNVTTQATARYFLYSVVKLTGFTLPNTVCTITLTVGASSFSKTITNPTTNDISVDISAFSSISASTAITTSVTVTGEAGNTVDIAGGSGPYVTYLSGWQAN